MSRCPSYCESETAPLAGVVTLPPRRSRNQAAEAARVIPAGAVTVIVAERRSRLRRTGWREVARVWAMLTTDADRKSTSAASTPASTPAWEMSGGVHWASREGNAGSSVARRATLALLLTTGAWLGGGLFGYLVLW